MGGGQSKIKQPQYLIENPTTELKDVPDLITENKIDSTTALEILIHFEGLTNVSKYMQTNFKLTYEDLLKINLSTEIVDALIMRYIYTLVIRPIDTSKLNGILNGQTLYNLIQNMKQNNTLYKGGKSKQRRKKNKKNKTKKRN